VRALAIGLLLAALTATGAIAGSPAAFADDYPTWDDLQQAKGDVDKQAAAVTQVTQDLANLQADVDAKQAALSKATDAYDAAEQALNLGQAKSDSLAASAAAAKTKADASSTQAAQLASQFARSGDTSVTGLLLTSSSGDADDLLSRLSSMSQLTTAVNGIYQAAQQDSNTAQSLSDQAQVAKDALTDLAAQAQSALQTAADAQKAAVQAVNEQAAHKTELEAQLTALQNNEIVTQQQYDAGVAARAAAAAAAAEAARAAAAAAQAAGVGGGASVGVVSSDAQSLAQELIADVNDGAFHGNGVDHIFEIQYIADGMDVPNCGIDVTILQAMVTAVRAFGSAGISDINRRCTGQIEGAGTASPHYMQGGGHAVDFTSVGGRALNGSNQASLDLISVLDPMMPSGSRVGQSECRYAAGDEPDMVNFTDFSDTCDHLHVDDF
jgi:hypothetical protein